MNSISEVYFESTVTIAREALTVKLEERAKRKERRKRLKERKLV